MKHVIRLLVVAAGVLLFLYASHMRSDRARARLEKERANLIKEESAASIDQFIRERDAAEQERLRIARENVEKASRSGTSAAQK